MSIIPETGSLTRQRAVSQQQSPRIDYSATWQVSDGNIVMNERTDVMRRKDGGEIALPVMGVFEVVDGKIAKWSDYFDMATVTKAFG